MPTITISRERLKSLIRKKISDSQLEELLFLNKIEVEEWADEMKLEVTADRPDFLSAEGIARQLNSWLGLSTGLIEYPIQEPKIKVIVNSVPTRPHIVCAAVRELQLDDEKIKSIMQLQELLDLTIGRDRVKTSIGLHDMSRVTPPFTYKQVTPLDYEFVPLGFSRKMNMAEILEEHPKGVKYAHTVSMKKGLPILVDSNDQVLSFPPIINGELTKVTEKTKDMFIDITGLDATAINNSLNIIVTALADMGGKIEGVMIGESKYPKLMARKMKFNFDNAKSLLALDLKNHEIRRFLERMGYGADEKRREVLVPAYRNDILHEVDLIEDIAIAYGYNNIVPDLPKVHSIGQGERLIEFSNVLRNLMVGMGFQEVLNYTITSPEKHFDRMVAPRERVVEISNPISSEYTILRRHVLPSIMENLSSNKNRKYPQLIFEAGDCVEIDASEETRTRNVRKLAGVICHSSANLSEIVSIINSIKPNLGLNLTLENCGYSFFIPGRSGRIKLKNEVIGHFGEVHPIVLEKWGLEKPVAAFEIDVEKLMKN